MATAAEIITTSFHEANGSAGLYFNSDSQTVMVYPESSTGVLMSNFYKFIMTLCLHAESQEGLFTIRAVPNNRGRGCVYFINMRDGVNPQFTNDQLASMGALPK